MRLSPLLPLAAFGTAIVIPDAEVMNQVAIEPHYKSQGRSHPSPKQQVSNVIDRLESKVEGFFDSTKNALDQAFDAADDTTKEAKHSCHETAFDAKSWVETNAVKAESKLDEFTDLRKKGHHHHKPNQTVYQLISKSKYTTKLAALIDEYDDLVKLLNGTTANFTIFAPIDSAFEKIPDDAPKPSKEELKAVLFYHVSKEFYPAGRVLVTHTVPTLLDGEYIGGKPQRLSTNIGLKGLTVNFFSRIIAINIFGTNGVIHGIDSILIPPPKAAEAIQYFPGEFSTLELGLTKTGLLPHINDTSTHTGGTLFAPDNFAFQKLGPKINAFLFSSYGLKYLKALLEYHVVADHTLYSDAYYKASSSSSFVKPTGLTEMREENVKENDPSSNKIPKGFFHVDLPTSLKDRSLSIDVARYGRLIIIKINGFSTVVVEDGIVADGVIQVVNNVLIPPKSVGGVETKWQGEEFSVEEFKERFESYVTGDGEL